MAAKPGGDDGKEGIERCAACDRDEILAYWCKTCNRSVAEKRCPGCGLKTQRKRDR